MFFAKRLAMKTEQESETQPDDELVVFSIIKDAKCSECGEELFRGSLLKMEQQKPLCLGCADLDHLVYLRRGDTALTRRSRKYSTLSAVVVQFSRTRGRYERQGVLVESAALARAQEECQSDEASRERARVKAAAEREAKDHEYLAEFTAQIVARFPGCPAKRAAEIAAHACLKYSGRVGRSAKAREFDAQAIDLAVRAHLRHTETNYDRLLNRGMDRGEARFEVAAKMSEVESLWRQPTKK
jgi:hypothetical protein